MAGWLGHMSHWLTQIGEKDYTSHALGPQREPLGVQYAVGRLQRKMDDALPSEYLERLRGRLQQEDGISDIHWVNLLFEMKRDFILAAMLRSYPRIGPEVEKIRRMMQLEPREYAVFQARFMPLADPASKAPNPDSTDRAVFDVAYVSLFEVTPFSQKLWGPFLKYLLSINFIRRCREEREALIDEAFSSNCRKENDLKLLVGVVVDGVSQAEAEVRAHVKALGPDPEVFRQRYDVKPETMWSDRALLLKIVVFQSLLPYFYGRSGGKRRGHPDLSLYSQMNI